MNRESSPSFPVTDSMERSLDEIIQTNVQLAAQTTIGLGGPALFFAHCESQDELRGILLYARAHHLRFMIMGGGSNIVFPDRGFDGMVIRIGLKGRRFETISDGVVLDAAAGEEWDPLVEESVRRSLTGIECLSGIPGFVGATPMQNVGAYGQEVAGTIQSVEALDLGSLKIVEFSNAECQFAYRQSRFKAADKDRFVITRVKFLLQPDTPPILRYPELRKTIEVQHGGAADLATVRATVLSLRRGKSMVIDSGDPNTRSVGSFFMNPIVEKDFLDRLQAKWNGDGNRERIPFYPEGEKTKIPAAWLVEQSGFRKGMRRGGVGISSNHALALVNYGGTSGELLDLAREIREEVSRKFSIHLQIEPSIVN
jgi:UDP-N-acetylmuramate dehydrogenase